MRVGWSVYSSYRVMSGTHLVSAAIRTPVVVTPTNCLHVHGSPLLRTEESAVSGSIGEVNQYIEATVYPPQGKQTQHRCPALHHHTPPAQKDPSNIAERRSATMALTNG